MCDVQADSGLSKQAGVRACGRAACAQRRRRWTLARQSRDLVAAALQSRAAAVQWSARWVQTLGGDEKTVRRWDLGLRQQTRGSLRAARRLQRNNASLLGLCIAAANHAALQRPTAKHPRRASPNNCVATRDTSTPHAPRASSRAPARRPRPALAGRFCHGDSATARTPELSVPMLPACVGLDCTTSIEPVWWRSPSCLYRSLLPQAYPFLPILQTSRVLLQRDDSPPAPADPYPTG
ncbi:hypothetical protein BKA58DRAFT_403626 [Alternaria rosae]|uniref:uncharacterized protein n=1 Tax=Alternaria rosae TaxID=1187941 RepID=UPI001E8E7EFC|nr:uncharacterized protein BKA58DRAFT_403626 [Alternaria rosae]KAH6866784.1 hypothetical protein BKA58DRAFT_403626 [Alternaria rosae]